MGNMKRRMYVCAILPDLQPRKGEKDEPLCPLKVPPGTVSGCCKLHRLPHHSNRTELEAEEGIARDRQTQMQQQARKQK
jgi:hypothetical protein